MCKASSRALRKVADAIKKDGGKETWKDGDQWEGQHWVKEGTPDVVFDTGPMLCADTYTCPGRVLDAQWGKAADDEEEAADITDCVVWGGAQLIITKPRTCYCYGGRLHENHSVTGELRPIQLRDAAVVFKATNPKIGITAGDFHAQFDGPEGSATANFSKMCGGRAGTHARRASGREGIAKALDSRSTKAFNDEKLVHV